MIDDGETSREQARRGALFGIGAAVCFGLSAPIAKRLLDSASPQVLAGLLYLGSGAALGAWRTARPRTSEAPLQRSDWPTLAAVVATGGVIGPLLMLVGLQRVSGVTGSLLLNLEGVFTIGLAVLAFREYLGTAVATGAALILLGGALLETAAASGRDRRVGNGGGGRGMYRLGDRQQSHAAAFAP